MGAKTLKEAYPKFAVVHKRRYDGNFTIGQPLHSEMAIVSPDGQLIKCDEYADRICPQIREDAKSGKLKELAQAEDVFGELHDIYTHNDYRVIKKQCEHYDWPNICTDGSLIYENTYFKTPAEAKTDLYDTTRRNVPYAFRNLNGAFRTFFKEHAPRLFRIIKEVAMYLLYYVLARIVNQ